MEQGNNKFIKVRNQFGTKRVIFLELAKALSHLHVRKRICQRPDCGKEIPRFKNIGILYCSNYCAQKTAQEKRAKQKEIITGKKRIWRGIRRQGL